MSENKISEDKMSAKIDKLGKTGMTEVIKNITYLKETWKIISSFVKEEDLFIHLKDFPDSLYRYKENKIAMQNAMKDITKNLAEMNRLIENNDMCDIDSFAYDINEIEKDFKVNELGLFLEIEFFGIADDTDYYFFLKEFRRVLKEFKELIKY